MDRILRFQNVPVLFGLSILLLQNAPVLFLDNALTLGESGPADLRPADPLPDTTAATLSLWTPP